MSIDANGKPVPPRTLTEWGSITAFIVVIAWLAVTAWQVLHSDIKSDDWGRLVEIRKSMETLVFAAAGALWGTKIQQARVADARRDTSTAVARNDVLQQSLVVATGDAEKGRSLAGAVLAHRAPVLASVDEATNKPRGDPLVAMANELLSGVRTAR